MPAFRKYNEPEGILLPVGDYLVKIKEIKQTRARVSQSIQLEVLYHCEAGLMTDYIPIQVKNRETGEMDVSFRVQQLMAATGGKNPDDGAEDQWAKYNAPQMFGNMESEAEIRRLAAWFMQPKQQERPFWISVIEQPDLNKVMRLRVGAFKDQRIRPCTDAQIKEWKPPISDDGVNGDPGLPEETDDLPF